MNQHQQYTKETILNIHMNSTLMKTEPYLWEPQCQRPIHVTLDLWGLCAGPGSWEAMLDFSVDHYHPDWWNGEDAVTGVILAVIKCICTDTYSFQTTVNSQLSLLLMNNPWYLIIIIHHKNLVINTSFRSKN